MGPSVFHSEFDNFDQLVNDITGRGSVHTAHGIMLQDFTIEQREEELQPQSLQKSKKHSLSILFDEEVEECYVTQRKSPSLHVTKTSVAGS